MARGQKSQIGEKRVSPNGYEYTCTQKGWKLTHRLLVEKDLGRELRPDERVRFRDGDRSNLGIGNLEVYKVKAKTKADQIARLEAKKDEIEAQLEELYDTNRATT